MFAAIVPGAARNLSFFSTTHSLERQRAYLEKMAQSETDLLFTIERVADEAAIGAAGLHEYDHTNRNARLGMLIFRPENRGLGYSRDAMNLILGHAFQVLHLHKVYIRLLARNEKALAKYQKMGFKVESTFREEYLLDGVFLDMIGLSLLDREWQAWQK
jgi:diamine N-acetyltransferase